MTTHHEPIPYNVSYTENDTITISSKSKSYTVHVPTHFPAYKLSPHNLCKETSNLTNKIKMNVPSLNERWSRGDFIHEKNKNIQRFSQYEYDKLCSDGIEYSDDNAKLFNQAQYLLNRL